MRRKLPDHDLANLIRYGFFVTVAPRTLVTRQLPVPAVPDQPVAIRFNNWIRDVDPLADDQFYDAYIAMWHMIRDPANVLTLRLAAGETLCFDNRRILHGRNEFDPQSGRRHLQGCYVDRDMVESRLRKLALG